MSLILQWKQNFTSSYNELSDSPKPTISVDVNGNFYIAYVCTNPQASQINVGLIDVCVVKINTDGVVQWFRQQPSFDTNQNDVDPDITVDANGNIYVTYCTSGSITGQTETISGFDVVVFKLNSDGDTLWVKQSNEFNTGINDTAPVIGTDSNGNVYVAYSSYDDPFFVEDKIILFKLDSNGNKVWAQKTNTFNTPGANYSPSIAVDDSGNCYVAYYCDGGAASGETSIGSYDIVVFKTDTNGNLVWIRQRPSFDTINDDMRPSITVDSYGAVYLANRTDGTVSGQSSAGYYDITVYKMDTNGNVVWIKQNPIFNTEQGELSPSIGVDPSGMIYVAYATGGTTSGQTLTGTQDVVVMQMDNDGNIKTLLQQSAFNTTYDNIYPCITIDLDGNCGVVYYSVNYNLDLPTQELVIFKLRNLVCVHGETQILMSNGTSKSVKEIQRGEIVAPNHQVARLCPERIDRCSKISLVVFEKNSLGNHPDQRLIVTPNHPIFYKNARRPAKCFAKCPGVTMLENISVDEVMYLFEGGNEAKEVYLYDLQFDHDGSYLANGVEVQSRSPYSYCGPLPKDLYYDTTLYSSDRVWDSMDQILPLESTKLDFNLIMLRNKRHEFNDKPSSNRIIHKNTKVESVSIIKYQ